VSSTSSTAFDPSTPWRVSPLVSLRVEAFGAMAYHHGTRRLVFLKSPQLVTLVRTLDQFDSADQAMDAVVESGQRDRFVTALSSLVASEILCGR
jgi:putative mycofactocin binding protein MftB